MNTTTAFARTIGWGTLGLAVVAFVAPAALSRLLGYGERPRLVLALGVRDLAIGVGLVGADDVRPWLKARFVAEVADTVMHAAGAATGSFGRKRALAITAAAAAGAGLEYVLLRKLSR